MKRIAPGSRQHKIAESIISDIQEGIYKKGEKLPSLRSLGSRYGVSHETVKLAMESLKERGILNVIPGNGAFVSVENVIAAAGQTHNVGVVLDSGLPTHEPSLVEPLFDRFFTLANRELAQYSYNQLTLDVCYELEEDRRNLYRALDKVDGVIVISMNTKPLLDLLSESGKPCVAMIPAMELEDFDSVSIDEFSTYYKATKEIIEKGYKRIAYFDGPDPILSYYNRKNGILSACRDMGIQFDENRILFAADWGLAHYCEAVGKWLDHKPDADILIAANDNFAISALKVFNERGIRVPDDIALLGAKNTSYSLSTFPQLATIDYRYPLLVRHAIERLMIRIEKKNLNPEPVKLNFAGDLIVRNSI